MGNACSSRSGVQDETEQGAPKFTGGIQRESPSPPPYVSREKRARPWDIQLSPAPLDDAIDFAPDGDTRSFMGQILRACAELGEKVHSDDMVEWETEIVVEERHRNGKKVQDGIKLMSWLLIVLCQAFNGYTKVSFMDYHNPEMESFAPEEVHFADLLDELYCATTVQQLLDQVSTGSNQPKSSQDDKIEVNEDKTPLETRVGELIADLQSTMNGIMTDNNIKPKQRHERMLAVIRDRRFDFSEPFNAATMTPEDFLEHFAKAQKHSEKQAKVLSSLGFTITRQVQQQRHDYADRERDITSSVNKKKIIIITGSAIDEAEFKHIKRELQKVTGGSSMFSIQVVRLTEGSVSHSSTDFQQKLDDARKSECDIYDHTSLDVQKLFLYGPSGLVLKKILNSHDRALDNVKRKNDGDFYGISKCSRLTDGKILLPRVEHIKEKLGATTAASQLVLK